MHQKREWLILLIALIPLIIVACKKRAPGDRCDYDGFPIQPLYAVSFFLQDGSEKKFCSLVCASMSFQRLKANVVQVRVADEVSGARIPAAQAVFVESDMVTVPHVKNRIHVFRNETDAVKHMRKFKGRRVENPFR